MRFITHGRFRMAHELDEWLRDKGIVWRFGNAATFDLAPNTAKKRRESVRYYVTLLIRMRWVSKVTTVKSRFFFFFLISMSEPMIREVRVVCGTLRLVRPKFILNIT